MKKISALLILTWLCIHAKAQTNYFEGRLTYQMNIRSKSKESDDQFFKSLYAIYGDKQVVTIKNGMMKQSFDLCDAWYIGPSKRMYYKFKNIDTLFYRDYSDDTSKVANIIKSDSSASMQGYPCKSISLKKQYSTVSYLYTDALQHNIEYEKDNTVDNADVLIRQIGQAMWLYSKSDYSSAFVTDSCVLVDQSPVNDQVFDLPSIPQKKYAKESIFQKGDFKGGSAAWVKYLHKNLNGNLGLRYIKIPKGEKEAAVQVIVEFIVSEDGSVSNVVVTNNAEVNPHLANEAIRVISKSPPWEAATFCGVKIKMSASQPINFHVVQ
jgi:protein TonB